MSRRRFAVAAALAAAAAWPAAAAAQSHRLAPAWEAALAEEEGYLTPAQAAELTLVAHQAAVARLCEGFVADPDKIAAATNAVLAAALDGLEGDAVIARHADILIALGTTHGLFLAEGSLQREAFCAEAAAARADPAFVHFWE